LKIIVKSFAESMLVVFMVLGLGEVWRSPNFEYRMMPMRDKLQHIRIKELN